MLIRLVDFLETYFEGIPRREWVWFGIRLLLASFLQSVLFEKLESILLPFPLCGVRINLSGSLSGAQSRP